MKTLILMRHGHAENEGQNGDASRNLDEQGRMEAREMGEYLLAQKLMPDLMMASHASRALQTAEIVAETLTYNVKNILIERDIYHTDVPELLEVIQRQDDKYHTLMLTGHNPTISDLARHLSVRAAEGFHTAGIAIFESTANNWDKLDTANIELKAVAYPGMGKE